MDIPGLEGCRGSAAAGVKMQVSSPTSVTLVPYNLKTIVILRARKVARRVSYVIRHKAGDADGKKDKLLSIGK